MAVFGFLYLFQFIYKPYTLLCQLLFFMLKPRGLITKRKYGEIVMPLQGVTDVMEHFKNYTDIPQIAQLAAEVKFQTILTILEVI